MSLRGFQQALVDLTLAPRTGPDALARYDLSPRERKRLQAIVRQPGMAVSRSLVRGNRLEIIAGAFPMTCVLLKPVLRGLLDELWGRHQPNNYQLAGEEAAFAAFLSLRLASGGLAIEYLDEIFRYEMACWEMALQIRTLGEQAVCETVVEFLHPPDLLLPPLSRMEAPPPGLLRGSYPTRVRLRESGLEVEGVTGPPGSF